MAAAMGLIRVGVVGYSAIQQRHIWNWLPTFVEQSVRPPEPCPEGPQHVMLVFADLFEPKFHHLGPERERERVRRWTSEYPALANAHRDADGRPPQHTFFLPYDQYEPWTLAAVNRLVFAGYGEVELALHHGGDTAETLRGKLEAARRDLNRRGALLTFEPAPRSRYGFIHGEWALDNAGGDAASCGVNTELDLLRETGCYADFTFPAFQQAAQPRTVNAIYYAVDTPGPKSYDTGVPAHVGRRPPSRGLLFVQGVLGLNWNRRRFGIMPRTEVSGNLFWQNPPTPERADYWVRANVHVEGRPEWTFIILRGHGAEESQMRTFFGGDVDAFFSYLERRYNDGSNYVLHYVTAREAFNIIKAAEAGRTGNPNAYRDYEIPPYANAFINSDGPYTLQRGGEELQVSLPAPGPAGLAFRERTLRAVEGRIASVRASAAGAELRTARAGDVVQVVTARPIAGIEGATVVESERGAGEQAYRLRLSEDGTVARWRYN